MIPTSVLIKLATLGLSEQQAEAVGAMLSQVEAATKEQADAVIEKSREKGRARLQKWREKQPQNVTKRFTTLPDVSKPLTRADDTPATEENKQTNKPVNKKTSRASDEAAFRSELASDLPGELLDGIIQVRRDKSGQVTGLSAQLFREDAAKCGMSVHDAAKACVTSSWITVKPHYFQGRGGSPPRTGIVGAAERILESKSNGSESIFGGNGDAKRLSTGRSSEPGGSVADLRGGLSRQFVRGGH